MGEYLSLPADRERELAAEEEEAAVQGCEPAMVPKEEKEVQVPAIALPKEAPHVYREQVVGEEEEECLITEGQLIKYWPLSPRRQRRAPRRRWFRRTTKTLSYSRRQGERGNAQALSVSCRSLRIADARRCSTTLHKA